MISVAEAKQLVADNCHLLETISIDLYEATHRILAEDIYSPSDSPPFDQSAMDGYAYKFSEGKEELIISGEIAAGDLPKTFSKKNAAYRIFTGAQVPLEFDTVVMQEKVIVKGHSIIINDPEQKKGMNIRLKGSQICKGDLAIKRGTLISPGLAGFLAGIGINSVKGIRKPQVSIISTGNELISPGTHLESGKVYESNTYSLNAVLSEIGIKAKTVLRVLDNEAQTKEAIERTISNCDVLILSGGVSVGDYDFVAKALEACGTECIFHQVKQKPGKPLYFGKKNKTLVFGLPGNPAALLTCYYEYVLPALKKMSGETHSAHLKIPLSSAYTKKAGLTHFLKAKMNETEVSILSSQESYLMNSFAMANCLVKLDEEKTAFEKGERVEVHLLT